MSKQGAAVAMNGRVIPPGQTKQDMVPVRTNTVTFDKSITPGSSSSDNDGHTPLPVPVARVDGKKTPPQVQSTSRTMSVITNLVHQTVGEHFENIADVTKIQAFIKGVEAYCASTESLASLGKSLYSTTAGVFVLDEAMRIILWNDYIAKITGYSREELAGRSLRTDTAFLIPPRTAAALQEAMSRCLQGIPYPGQVLEFQTRSGPFISLLSTCTPLLSNPIGAGMLIMAQEVGHLIQNTTSNGHGEVAAAISTGTSNEESKKIVVAAGTGASDPPAPNSSSVMVSAPIKMSSPVKSNASKIPGWSDIAPDYSIECLLGQGSYGQVVRCKHIKTGEIVAIKKIQNVFSDPIDAKRILRELCIVRQLRHPNIVQIREIIAPRDLVNFHDLFVVFEYLPSDLEKLLHSPQFLTAEHLRWLLLDLLKALKYMHSAEIVHRDLKPANVLLNLSPVAIKICDFGLARGLSSAVNSSVGRKRKRLSGPDDRGTLEGTGVHPRTPGRRVQRQLTEHVVTRWYRAPEIIFRDKGYSAAIDVWSVGCIFAELLSMQKSSIPSHYQREPLFPGVSCFPLSPGAGQVALPQDSRDQLNTILDVLGTMDEDDIQDIADPDVRLYLRNLPPRPRKDLQKMYPGAEPEAIDLLTRMLHMNPKKRATLDEALSHRYLSSIRSLEEEIVAPGTIELDFDEKKMKVSEIRTRMVREIQFYHPEVGKPKF